MTINQAILDKFSATVSETIKDRIDSLFLDASIEEDYFESIDEAIASSVESVASLDLEIEVYDFLLQVVVESINDHLDTAIQTIKDMDTSQGNVLLWSPNSVVSPLDSSNITPGSPVLSGEYTPAQGLPSLEETGNNYKIPYQINYSYIDHDSGSRSNGVDPDGPSELSSPGHREPNDPVISYTYEGDTRILPGIRIKDTEPSYEFFTDGIEVYYYRPVYSSSDETPQGGGPPETVIGITEEKVIVYDTSSAQALSELVNSGKILFYIFELLRNGVEQTSGAYTQTVNLYSSIDRMLIQKDNFIFKTDLLKELVNNGD